jgi:glycosyltransferase involved in cell wall biosynthesis
MNKLKRLLRAIRDYYVIKNSGLFDAHYYLTNNSDVRHADINPLKHYVKHGGLEGRNPSSEFDANFYIKDNPDVKEFNVNPLAHYLRHGKKEGRSIKKVEAPVFHKPSKKQNSEEFVFVEYQKHEKLNTKLKTIAFYLPQFHPFPENDKWWGKGFTEWTNVTKAKPNFVGHYQPHLPIHNGFYDLRVPEVMIEQARLARNYGINGFNFYYYWFDGKVLMHKPFEILLEHKEIDINFCITWANENWTRRWDGQENDILIAQNHSEEDSIKFLDSLYKYFNDDRYIRIDNKPVLIIYRANIIPKMKETVELWRKKAKKDGFEGLYLICAQSFGIKSPEPYGFDAAMEFPPHTAQSNQLKNIELINKEYDGFLYDYSQVVENTIKFDEPSYKLFRTAMLSWDNTARKQNHSHIFCNFSLSKYKKWLSHIASNVFENNKYDNDEKLIFVNAWNEWAEGTHLEPDRKFGYGYLETTYQVLKEYTEKHEDIDILIVIDKFTNSKFIETIKWFKERTSLNILTISIDGCEKTCEIRLKNYDKLSEIVGALKLQVKIKSIYLENIGISKHSLLTLNRFNVPIVFNTKGEKINDISDVFYVDFCVKEDDSFELKILEALYKETDLKPKVSILVPTYNHEKFLKKRLDSIINQTFQDFELIVLDDCSKDGSLSLLKKYASERPSTLVLTNEQNSGTPFAQWAKGIHHSRGEIIWIAEDDDYCENNFLEKLLPSFNEDNVKLSFCQSYMVDENEQIIGNYKQIFSRVSSSKWDKNYVLPAYEEVKTSLAIRNTIPNVSAVLFRKINIEDFLDDLLKYKFAGDWFFYLNLLSDGSVAFVSDSLNYHRRHTESVMSNMNDDSYAYFLELKNVHDFVLESFVLDSNTIQKMSNYIEDELKHRNLDFSNDVYPLERFSTQLVYKKQKNIAVFFSGYYFGGAEIFPINLANAFAELGHNVYLFDVGSLDADEKVKAMVSPLVKKVDIEGTKNSQSDLKAFLEDNRIDVINSQGWFATDFIQKNLTWNIHYIPWFASLHGHEEAIINGDWGDFYLEYFNQAMKNTIKKGPYFIYTHPKNLEVFTKFPLKNKDRLIELPVLGAPSFLPNAKLKSQLNISRKSFVVGFIGRGIPEKGWEQSIEAVRLLNEKHKLDTHLVCIGDSAYVQDLKQRTNLEYIHFLGMSDEVMEWTQMFDVALLPSFYKSESHPLVIMGYLSAGKPVISTPLGNISDMLDYKGEKAGFLVNLDSNGRPSSSEIAMHIKNYIENHNLYLSHSVLAKKAFKKFNMRSCAVKYVDKFLSFSKKNLYIHIGLPKTGTSAIQKFFTNNEDILKKKYNLYYPKLGRWVDGSHHEIAFFLGHNPYIEMKSPVEQRSYLDCLDLELNESGCRDILLSSECFHLYTNYNFISKFSYHYNIKIICYLRRQDEYIESMYSQAVKDNVYKESRPFQEYLAAEKDKLYFSVFLDRWKTITDKSNFIIKIYESDRFKDRSVVEDFMDIFSVEINSGDFVFDLEKVNRSLCQKVLEYKVLLNRVLDKPSDKLTYILEELNKDESYENAKLNFFTPAERKAFMDAYVLDNKKVVKDYNLNCDDLFSQDTRLAEPGLGLRKDDIVRFTNFIARHAIDEIKMIDASIRKKTIHPNDSLLNFLKSAVDDIVENAKSVHF